MSITPKQAAKLRVLITKYTHADLTSKAYEGENSDWERSCHRKANRAKRALDKFIDGLTDATRGARDILYLDGEEVLSVPVERPPTSL